MASAILTVMTNLLTPEEVAERLRVSPRSVRRWIADGKLSAVTLPSGRVRIDEVAIDALIASGVAS
jgi:excisionase family DNA binding protein